MVEFKATSGAKVEIAVADFWDVMKLKNAIQREYSQNNIKLNLDLKNLSLDSDLDINEIIKVVMQIDSSEEVQAAIFNCLKKSKYKGEKITPATFENEEAWQDYYEILMECLKVNFTPFLKGLASRFKGLLGNLTQSENPKLK